MSSGKENKTKPNKKKLRPKIPLELADMSAFFFVGVQYVLVYDFGWYPLWSTYADTQTISPIFFSF